MQRKLTLFFAVWIAANLLSIRLGHAQAPTTVHVVYRAPAQCPNGDDFQRELAARTHGIRWSERDTGTVLSVDLDRTANAVRGRVRIDTRIATPSDAAFSREISGADCEDAFFAVVLIAALALDPQATTQPVLLTRPPKESLAPSPRPPAAPTTFEGRVGVASRLTGGVAPRAAVELAAFVEGHWNTSRLFSPTVRLAAFRTATGDIPLGDGVGSWRLLGVRLDGCPITVSGPWHLAFRPCATFEIGDYQGEGKGRAISQTEQRLWLAWGANGNVEWSFASRWQLQAQGGVFVPLEIYRFVLLNPALTLHQVPKVAGFGGLALSWQLL